MGKMNIGLQKYQLKKKLEKEGVPSDLIDVSKMGEIDPTLHLDEQITQFERKFPTLFPKKEMEQAKSEAQRGEFIRNEAQKLHRNRPRWDRRIDESIQAERIVKNTEKGLRKWAMNPDQVDVEGVDTKRSRKERTKARRPRSKTKNFKNLFELAERL